MLRKSSIYMSDEQIFSDLLLNINSNAISKIFAAGMGQGYEIKCVDVQSAIRLKSSINSCLKNRNNYNCGDHVRFLNDNNGLPAYEETNLIEVWGDAADLLSEYIEFCIFKSDYCRKYSTTLFTNPFSEMKQKLEDGTINHTSDIKKYAKEYPSSRTAEVLQQMDLRNHNGPINSNVTSSSDFVSAKILVIGSDIPISKWLIKTFGQANFPGKNIEEYTSSSIINDINNEMRLQYTFEYEAIQGDWNEYYNEIRKLSSTEEMIKFSLKENKPHSVILHYHFNQISEAENILNICKFIRQINPDIPMIIIATNSPEKYQYRRLDENEIKAENNFKRLQSDLPLNTSIIKIGSIGQFFDEKISEKDVIELKKTYQSVIKHPVDGILNKAVPCNDLLNEIVIKLNSLDRDLGDFIIVHEDRKRDKIKGLNALYKIVNEEKQRILNGENPRSLAEAVNLLRYQYPLLDAGYFSETKKILDLAANIGVIDRPVVNHESHSDLLVTRSNVI